MRIFASKLRVSLVVLVSICLLGTQSSLAQDHQLVGRKL